MVFVCFTAFLFALATLAIGSLGVATFNGARADYKTELTFEGQWIRAHIEQDGPFWDQETTIHSTDGQQWFFTNGKHADIHWSTAASSAYRAREIEASLKKPKAE